MEFRLAVRRIECPVVGAVAFMLTGCVDLLGAVLAHERDVSSGGASNSFSASVISDAVGGRSL